MRSVLKLLHLIGMAGFLGSLAVCLTPVLHDAHTTTDPMTYVVKHVTLPSLWIILATGLVLTALQKQLAVWVYAKIAIGVVVLFVALFVFTPLVLLALGLGAATLGVFRPRGAGADS